MHHVELVIRKFQGLTGQGRIEGCCLIAPLCSLIDDGHYHYYDFREFTPDRSVLCYIYFSCIGLCINSHLQYVINNDFNGLNMHYVA